MNIQPKLVLQILNNVKKDSYLKKDLITCFRTIIPIFRTIKFFINNQSSFETSK